MLACAPVDKIVVFPDIQLENKIREEIGKPGGEIRESDLEQLTELDATSLSISDIEGKLKGLLKG